MLAVKYDVLVGKPRTAAITCQLSVTGNFVASICVRMIMYKVCHAAPRAKFVCLSLHN